MQASSTSVLGCALFSDHFYRFLDDFALQRDHVRRPGCEIVKVVQLCEHLSKKLAHMRPEPI